MSKKHKKTKIEVKQKSKKEFRLSPLKRDIGTFILVFVLLIVLFSPMAFKNLRPGGVDVIGSKGANHQKRELKKETGETALWNSPVFSGMPCYHRLGGEVTSADTILTGHFSKIIYLYFWLYLIGFIGMYYLLRFLKLSYWSALLGSLAYIFIPHFMSLLSIGHFAKFRPIMYIPLVTFFFMSFMQKKHWGWLLGFIFSFTVQIRTQHYQIIFYQVMILVFIGIYFLINYARDKNYKLVAKKLLLSAAASILILIMVAQPLFVTSEYTPYSIRGGTGEKGSTGLSEDYATRWSLNPSEILVWVMPRFFGGISGEIYTGSKVAQLKDRAIPGYWGTMPFTQAYDYIGILLILLAILGLVINWKKGLIKTLLALFLLSLLISFGRHFPLIYNLFFQYVPAFNKFRVPSMISVVLQFILVIYAAYGFDSLLKFIPENKKKVQKILLGTAVVFIILGMIPYLFGSSFGLVKEGDAQQYDSQSMSLIKSARLDMMQTDGLRLIFYTLIIYLILYLYLNGKLKKAIMVGMLLIILLIDQVPYVKKAEGELQNIDRLEKIHFKEIATDKFLDKDDSYYRVFPITENPFNTNDWSYRHNSIGGYSAAKLRIYQDIIENCLYDQGNPRNILNWNIIKMLNCKYIISKQQLPVDELQQVYQDKKEKLLTYQTNFAVEPAWFVKNYKVFPEREKRFLALNDYAFDSYRTAILEHDPELEIDLPDSSSVVVSEVSFNRMSYDVYTDKPSLLVVSEVFYPKGWKCYIDGVESEIFKTNHILRSVYIGEPGQHEVKFVFSPDRYNRLTTLSLIGHIILYALLAFLLVKYFIGKKKKPQVD